MCKHKDMDGHVCVCVCVSVFVCVYVCVYMCVSFRVNVDKGLLKEME